MGDVCFINLSECLGLKRMSSRDFGKWVIFVLYSGTSISRNIAFYIYLRSKWNADLQASPVPGVPGFVFLWIGMDEISRNV